MRDQGGGSIINVASVGAYIGGAGNSAYAASKAGLVVLTKVMAREWAPGNVRVNAISPGPFVSEMMLGALIVQHPDCSSVPGPRRAGQGRGSR